MKRAFDFAHTPSLLFGNGKRNALPRVLKNFGNSILLVTGVKSFTDSDYGRELPDTLQHAGITVFHYTIDREPTPDMIDSAVLQFGEAPIHTVVAVGGGSVMDAGKAIAAMLPLKDKVKSYLEGVGDKDHPGDKIPFVAMPTTAGTGSEATKNAVISEIGPSGFKKSLRHNNFVPEVAIVDPELTISCSPFITATSGMDAFTQLLESYLSTQANPMTDALALKGLEQITTSLLSAYKHGDNADARSGMALAAYLSGVTLANAGLGLVHGFASSIGGSFDIAHGVICSALMAPANRITVRKLRAENYPEALHKYETVGKLFCNEKNKSSAYYVDFLIDLMAAYTHQMAIPSLKEYGITTAHVKRLVTHTENKYNPVALSTEEITEVLEGACG